MTPLITAIQRSAVATSQRRSLGVSDMVRMTSFGWSVYSIHILFPSCAQSADVKVPHAFYNRGRTIIATDHATNPRKATQPADRVRGDALIRPAGDDGTPGHRSRSLVASAHRAVDRRNRSRSPLRPFFVHSCRARLGVAWGVVGG